MSADWGGSAADTTVDSVADATADNADDGSAGSPSGRSACSGSARPVLVPGPGSVAVLSPLAADAIRLGPGFWRERVAVNGALSLESGLARIEAAGTLENLRLAAGIIAAAGAGSAAAQGAYHGKRPFLDTDVFKWLEAVSWHMQHNPSTEWSARADEVIALRRPAKRPVKAKRSQTLGRISASIPQPRKLRQPRKPRQPDKPGQQD